MRYKDSAITFTREFNYIQIYNLEKLWIYITHQLACVTGSLDFKQGDLLLTFLQPLVAYKERNFKCCAPVLTVYSRWTLSLSSYLVCWEWCWLDQRLQVFHALVVAGWVSELIKIVHKIILPFFQLVLVGFLILLDKLTISF